MKSLIQAVAVAVVLSAPIASFAQPSGQAGAQDMRAVQTQAAGQQRMVQADNSGYGPGSHGTWQAGRGSDVTVSSYSPPIYNAR
ncbi:hypothetical protein [Paraburkholderia rhynchosiae]|uniref:DUF4148 domain-containing protein n=1 Tax=Paraburkholderia rhynchosiae TaxID=487049 RepID=A0A2N7VRT5_9BURK|nr:hypothetical protein [Paraburkholderia rhynchosiae]PMS19842.1 hypothetical protein C0Z16_35060 [Paraburkholderia rhynchosiae]CAB3724853.1 hypothetical protein LMG27174_05271 [Paraburkholderia rhynchosiae]